MPTWISTAKTVPASRGKADYHTNWGRPMTYEQMATPSHLRCAKCSISWYDHGKLNHLWVRPPRS